MVKEWANLFRGLNKGQLEELARSFAFENCVEREDLNKALNIHNFSYLKGFRPNYTM
ncbi:hypothetical protein CPB84DRAFT_1761328 [Gymnopilus junonius]|uniref:Uncharacterized protein n=1 Tax=Gymnopilus junonius TaxID=109634 RepID=A0A9P5NX17_GYMJU|nr:hypothetical protein CPB84DRAFT_1761328 [Gymnopilus junonius]